MFLGKVPFRRLKGASRARIPAATSSRLSGPSSQSHASSLATLHASLMAPLSAFRRASNVSVHAVEAMIASHSCHTVESGPTSRISSRWAALSRSVCHAIGSFSMETASLKSQARVREKPSPKPPGPAKRSTTGTVIVSNAGCHTGSANFHIRMLPGTNS